jgi:CheY-like chemotaxis protein
MAKPYPIVLRILVVDDQPIACEYIRRALILDGHTVEIARSGKEALALFEKDKFDLVTVDYEMPEMKGDELVLVIKALAPSQPIAMVTASPEKLAGNLLEDVDLMIGKPFEARGLRNAIKRLVAKP